MQQLMTTDDNRYYLTCMTHYYFNPMKQSENSCRLYKDLVTLAACFHGERLAPTQM
jgi:hypothetical protein